MMVEPSAVEMRLDPLPLDGAFRLIPEPIFDARGFFARCFERQVLQAVGLEADFPEWSLSYNKHRGTLRGLHWQAAPRCEVKIVQCIRGAVFDVIVDVRPHSPTRARWHAVELTSENRHLLYVPRGFAHGFQALCDEVELLYHISEPFHTAGARGVRWDDPDLSIGWPIADAPLLSERDANLPLLAEIETLA